MNFAQKAISKLYLKRQSPVNKFTVCDKISPILVLHRISIKESLFIFPDYEYVYEAMKGKKELVSTRDCIRFEDIVHLDETEVYVEIVTRTGFVHLLSKEKPERTYFNMFSVTHNKPRLWK